MERAIMCPQCNAPLKPHQFARSIVCPYCGATVRLDEGSVSAARFRETFRAWNAPNSYQYSAWLSIGDSHWALDRQIAEGEISNVYAARRARWPTELVLLKLLRDEKDAPILEHEWEIIQSLHRSTARGAETFTSLIPQPVLHGRITDGAHAGKLAAIYRWASGFRSTAEQVRNAYSAGIPPRASVWVWRRILEVLSFVHASGTAHGAVLPPHLLIQENEHGLRLVDYTYAGHIGEPLRSMSAKHESFYPRSRPLTLTPQLDLIMSARCIATLLGGDATASSMPSSVPGPLADLVRRISRAEPAKMPGQDAWALREEVGAVGEKVFGKPEFVPIEMPS